MAEDPDPEELLNEVIDVLALGYPVDGTAQDKAAWMANLQDELESRAPAVQASLRGGFRDS